MLTDTIQSTFSSIGSPALLMAVQLSKSVLDEKTDTFVVICEKNHEWPLTQLDNLFEHWHFRQPLEFLTLKTP